MLPLLGCLLPYQYLQTSRGRFWWEQLVVRSCSRSLVSSVFKPAPTSTQSSAVTQGRPRLSHCMLGIALRCTQPVLCVLLRLAQWRDDSGLVQSKELEPRAASGRGRPGLVRRSTAVCNGKQYLELGMTMVSTEESTSSSLFKPSM